MTIAYAHAPVKRDCLICAGVCAIRCDLQRAPRFPSRQNMWRPTLRRRSVICDACIRWQIRRFRTDPRGVRESLAQNCTLGQVTCFASRRSLSPAATQPAASRKAPGQKKARVFAHAWGEQTIMSLHHAVPTTTNQDATTQSTSRSASRGAGRSTIRSTVQFSSVALIIVSSAGLLLGQFEAKDPGVRTGSPNTGQPIAGLTSDQMAYFTDGQNDSSRLSR